jgi:hypothetical protein
MEARERSLVVYVHPADPPASWLVTVVPPCSNRKNACDPTQTQKRPRPYRPESAPVSVVRPGPRIARSFYRAGSGMYCEPMLPSEIPPVGNPETQKRECSKQDAPSPLITPSHRGKHSFAKPVRIQKGFPGDLPVSASAAPPFYAGSRLRPRRPRPSFLPCGDHDTETGDSIARPVPDGRNGLHLAPLARSTRRRAPARHNGARPVPGVPSAVPASWQVADEPSRNPDGHRSSQRFRRRRGSHRRPSPSRDHRKRRALTGCPPR